MNEMQEHATNISTISAAEHEMLKATNQFHSFFSEEGGGRTGYNCTWHGKKSIQRSKINQVVVQGSWQRKESYVSSHKMKTEQKIGEQLIISRQKSIE